jgi:iron-regulated transporter 1
MRLEMRGPSSLVSPFRRSTSPTSFAALPASHGSAFAAPSPKSTVNGVFSRQPSMPDLEEERRSFGLSLQILEPRPVVYWGSMEERMESF